jgi:hypothetical protein
MPAPDHKIRNISANSGLTRVSDGPDGLALALSDQTIAAPSTAA